ncbi:MAG: hypothetical protein OHK0013_08360 [Sandaracinaceae bacterium]
MQTFPWHALPRVHRADATLLERASSRLDADALAKARDMLGTLLGVGVSVRPGAIDWTRGEALAPTLVAVVGVVREGRWALELSPSLALALVDRVLGGDGEPAPVPGLLDAVERGVLAYLAARVGLGEVLDVVTTREGLVAWVGDEGAAAWSLAVTVGAHHGDARLFWPARTLRALAHAPPEGPIPGWVAEVPLSLALRIARARLEAQQLEALEPGDVLVPDELTYWPDREALRTAWLEVEGWRARVERAVEGWRVLAIERGAVRTRASAQMEGVGMREPVDEELGVSVSEVPVEITVELGRLELRVRELAALVPGRIVSARVPVGGAVTLRAGDRAIATGELVDLDGELGVRIVAVHR